MTTPITLPDYAIEAGAKVYMQTVNRFREMSEEEEAMTDLDFSNVILKEGLVAYHTAALTEMVKRGDALTYATTAGSERLLINLQEPES